MKKMMSLLVFSIILFLSLSINVSASSDLGSTNEEFEEGIPEEGFVETEEFFPEVGFEGEGVLVPTTPGGGYNTDSIIRTVNWKLVSKTKKPNSYGAWKTCVDDISRKGSVGCTLTTSISNTYSGSLKVPIKTVEASLGYSLTEGNQVMVRKDYNNVNKKRVRIIYRPVYTTYQLKQNRVLGSRVLETSYVTSRKYSHVQYDIVEY